MSQQLDTVVRVAGYDLDSGIGFNVAIEVPEFAVDADCDSGARESLTYAGCDFGTAGGFVELTVGAIRQGIFRHIEVFRRKIMTARNCTRIRIAYNPPP